MDDVAALLAECERQADRLTPWEQDFVAATRRQATGGIQHRGVVLGVLRDIARRLAAEARAAA